MKNKIEKFTLHGDSGVSVLEKDFLVWLETHRSSELGAKIIAYSWSLNGNVIKTKVDIGLATWHPLPDGSGFICFEQAWKPDNCLLLDVYGNERMRLTVPCELTIPKNPESAKEPTSFANVSAPYVNPADGKMGTYGVTAWVQHAGRYYFELDYHTGQFLWGKEIRD